MKTAPPPPAKRTPEFTVNEIEADGAQRFVKLDVTTADAILANRKLWPGRWLKPNHVLVYLTKRGRGWTIDGLDIYGPEYLTASGQRPARVKTGRGDLYRLLSPESLSEREGSTKIVQGAITAARAAVA